MHVSENYVYNVVIKDHSLTLNINRFEGSATALSHWLHIVTIKKEDVKNINEFNVSVRTVEKPRSSVVVSVSEDHVRDVYLNGIRKNDFQG